MPEREKHPEDCTCVGCHVDRQEPLPKHVYGIIILSSPGILISENLSCHKDTLKHFRNTGMTYFDRKLETPHDVSEFFHNYQVFVEEFNKRMLAASKIVDRWDEILKKEAEESKK